MLPKAMAYAAVAGVPPAYGLYASCAPRLGGSLRQQPPAVHRPRRRHDRPGPRLAPPLRRALLRRLRRVGRLPDAHGRHAQSPLGCRPAGVPCPGDPHPRHRRLHRWCGAPYHRHAGRPRVGRATSDRASGRPPAGLPGGDCRGLVPPGHPRTSALRHLYHNRPIGAAGPPRGSRGAHRRRPLLGCHVRFRPPRARCGDGGGAANPAPACLRPGPGPVAVRPTVGLRRPAA
jgi:hypothetical protein